VSGRAGRILLVTGPVGSGKTSHLEALAATARERGESIAGVLTSYRLENGRRAGLEICDLHTGRTRALAWAREASDPRAGPFDRARWRFDPVGLDWAARVLATSPPVDLLVIDELGPLEFDQGLGLSPALALLDRRAYDLAAVAVRHTRLEHARRRWPDARVVCLPLRAPGEADLAGAER
jgi:nucleoside-triphosphatase THEP1